MKKYLTIIILALLVSCQNQQSVQEYLVEKQNDPAFKTMSLTPDILLASYDGLSEEQIKTVKKIKSVNFAYLSHDDQKFTSESETLENIIKLESYESLMRMNDGSQKMNLLYLGEPEDIDELLFYGKSENFGMILSRVNSKELEPNDMVKIVKILEKLELDQVGDFMESIISENKNGNQSKNVSI
ncbi:MULTISPECIES: DUF4252 domain-containing protein [Psychroflexus]|uniref:DUF4252 domain-containing protein n=1 Tax=Psychroflexus halocasei TaxID=908615 RepID=A0A1H3Y6B6_9FLAO|nr:MULTISPECIES: DUF4252 domain-containing protein [Psychroflexus]PJX24653.1 hypothetical protein CAP47_03990 [Psychroflexus sp. S27]SEA06378.1 protein of unknown function [Psychroflexus halocasei]